MTEGSEFESWYGQKFSLLNVVQTGSEAHPASHPMGTGGSFPGVKRPGFETHNSPWTSAEVKKMWIYTSTPSYAFIAGTTLPFFTFFGHHQVVFTQSLSTVSAIPSSLAHVYNWGRVKLLFSYRLKYYKLYKPFWRVCIIRSTNVFQFCISLKMCVL
jgi:hypothetical protein